MSVTCKDRYFSSTCGQAQIHYKTWKNDSAESPIGIYLIAHGVCEHIARFDEFARYLAERGFVVYGEDHIGHGQSAATIEDIGLMAPDADEYIIEDMHVLYNIAKTENPGIPVFLLGHSMGSFIAKLYSAKYGDGLKGVVYCGLGCFPNFLRYIEKPWKLVMNAIGPDKRIVVNNNMLTISWISADKDNKRDYLKDELIAKGYSVGLIRDLGLLAEKSSKNGWCDGTVPDNLPILQIAGSMDIIGFCGIGVRNSEKQLKVRHSNVETIMYKGMRHEILREKKAKNQVFKDVYDWTMKNFD